MFFEALGDPLHRARSTATTSALLEQALRRAASWHGPIVLHVVTTKGKGYAPAEADDIACLHDMKASAAPRPATRPGGAYARGPVSGPR